MAQAPLDPAILKAMREGYGAYGDRFENRGGQFFDKQTGKVYDPQMGGQALSGDGSSEGGAGRSNNALSGYIQYAQGKNKTDDPYSIYNSSDGSFDQSGKFKDVKALQGLAQWALMAATMGYALPGLMGQGAGAGVGGAGGFIGEGAMSGVGAWDAAMAGATPGMSAAGAGAAGAGAAGAAGGGGGLVSAGLEAIPLSTSTLATAGTPLALGGSAAAGLGGLVNALPGGVGSLLNLAVPAIGAALGSQGQEQSQTTTREPWKELNPYLLGDNGVFKLAHQQMLDGRAPAQAAAQRFGDIGGSLLNTRQRGNSYDQFAGRRI